MDKLVEKVKLAWSKTNRWHRGFFVLIITEFRFIPSRQHGFHCNDPALSHPFTGDTISWKWLIGVSLLLPFIVMLIVERKYHSDNGRWKKRTIRWYKEYAFGVLLNLAIVQLLKVLVGSPRPHFFDTCKPNEATTCQGVDYVSSYSCSKPHWSHQSDKSFPSGHTSVALHAGFFIAYYLYQRCSLSNKRRAILQSLSITTAVFCAVSRMTDHRHHWWDVLGGIGIGIFVLLYTIINLCKNFECSNEKIKSEPPIENQTNEDNDTELFSNILDNKT